MIRERLITYIFRISVIVVWCCLIVAFLYAGTVGHWLRRGKSINILVWGAILDKEFVKDFEQETGVHINMSYLENNEELFVKLRSTDTHDYDIIMPSEWALELLIKEGLVKKIDHEKITVWDDIYPVLLNQDFDPGNNYSVPFYWSLFGIGIDTAYFDGAVPSTWGLVFDQALMPKRISMPEEPRHIVAIAALYLYGRVRSLTNQQVDQIKQLLCKQKRHVEVYTDLRPEYILASGAVPIVVGLSGDLLKVMRRFDNLTFMLPDEGGFANIDSFALPVTTKKDDLIYEFLNYLCKPETVQKYVDKFDFFSATKVVTEYDDRFVHLTVPTQELFEKVTFFKSIVSKEILNDILLTLKA